MSRIACSKHFSTSSGFQSMPVAHQTRSAEGPTAAPRIPSDEPPPRLKARGLFWEVLVCVALAKYWW